MMSFSIIVTLTILLVANVAADQMQCPSTSKGQYPNCVCPEKEYPYDRVNNICPFKVNIEVEKCPLGSVGEFPNCICKDNKIFNPQLTECVIVDKTQCPVGSTKVNNKCVCEAKYGHKYEFDEIFWICRPWYLPTPPPPTPTKPTPPTTTLPPCPPNKYYDKITKECVWKPCPSGHTSSSGYWPDCIPLPTCAAHQTGVYPHCVWLECPSGYRSKSGFWPDCRHIPCEETGTCTTTPTPCPPHHYRNPKTGKCEKVPCPPPNENKYQPDCPTFKPQCPKEYPGVWPYCNIYQTTPATKVTTTPASTTTKKTTTTTTTKKTTTPTTTPTTTTSTTTTTTTTPRPPAPTPCSNKCYCEEGDEIIYIDAAYKYKAVSNKKNYIF